MTAAAPHIVVVHGLGRSKHDMFLLAPRLRRALPDSTIHLFDYHSRTQTLAESTEKLAEFVTQHTHGEPVSFVGHSLGGIVARSLDASGFSHSQLKRLVTLGSPHNGATIAAYLSRYKTLRSIFGPILTELGSLNLPQHATHLQVGCIIGETGTRFGFFPLLGEDNDGLVLSREALFAGCVAHTSLFAFHGLMPFSAKIADLSARFLRSGSFE